MRLLLVGAFPYPHDQGSQVYFQEQAIALRAAGARVELLTYASRRPAAPDARSDPPQPERALDGFDHHTPPAWTAPRSLRSGPGWGKPLADLGLVMTLRDAVASKDRPNGYDAILTHNAEAALAAMHGLPRRRPAILYCLHTLLGSELSSYLKSSKSKGFQPDRPTADRLRHERRRTQRTLDALGAGIDHWLAARVDGWIALTQASFRVMKSHSERPGVLLPPPIPDPFLEPDWRRGEPERARIVRGHGLEPGGYFLYCGNLDGYQELDLLAAAAARLGPEAPPIVIASHEDDLAARGSRLPGIVLRRVASAEETRALLAGARASLVTRRAEGGFPIKLVNSLALGTPAITLLDREWGLVDGQSALVGRLADPVASIAGAILRLAGDDALARRLSSGARELYLAQHSPPQIARRTLELIDQVVAAPRTGDRAAASADRSRNGHPRA